MMHELVEKEVCGPVPVLILRGDPPPPEIGDRPPPGEVVLTRADAVRLHAELGELVDRWR